MSTAVTTTERLDMHHATARALLAVLRHLVTEATTSVRMSICHDPDDAEVRSIAAGLEDLESTLHQPLLACVPVLGNMPRMHWDLLEVTASELDETFEASSLPAFQLAGNRAANSLFSLHTYLLGTDHQPVRLGAILNDISEAVDRLRAAAFQSEQGLLDGE